MNEFKDVMTLPSYEEFREVLASLTALAHLILSKIVFDASADDRPTPLQMPCLHSLTVFMPYNDDTIYHEEPLYYHLCTSTTDSP